MDASDSKDGNLGARIETEAEKHTKREHFPRGVNELEQLAKDASQEPQVRGLVVAGPGYDAAHLDAIIVGTLGDAPLDAVGAGLTHELVQDPGVAGAEDEENDGADDAAHESADILGAPEPVAEGAAGGRDGDAGDDDDGAVAEGEEGADGDGPLAGSDEAPGGEVDGGDVVGVEGVAKAEDVGKGGRADEGGMAGEGPGDDGPGDEVDEEDEGDDA